VNLIRSTVCLVLGLALLLSTATVATAAEPPPSPIPDLQDPSPAPSYLGTPAVADPVQPPSAYQPALTFMHGNAGNTGSLDFPGPLGIDPTVGSAVTTSSSPFMWGKDGTLTTGCRVTVESVAYSCLAAVEPKTLTTEARWLAPAGQTARGAYIVMNAETKQIYVPTTQGKIFVVQREDGAAGPTFSTLREIDLSSVLLSGESPLVVMPDTRGDIWFATGAILGAGETSAPNMTYGFVAPTARSTRQKSRVRSTRTEPPSTAPTSTSTPGRKTRRKRRTSPATCSPSPATPRTRPSKRCGKNPTTQVRN
jgi:hypothetical protein